MNKELILRQINIINSGDAIFSDIDWFMDGVEFMLGINPNAFNNNGVSQIIYVIDQRWGMDHGISKDNLDIMFLTNFYIPALQDLNYNDNDTIMALYLKLKGLLDQYQSYINVDESSNNEIIVSYLFILCQINAINNVLRINKEALCHRIPPSIESIDHNA